MKNLLISERWRPKKMDDIILLPRIRKVFDAGLNQNVILYGHYGTGKTSLARILIGRWSKNSPFLELNSSFYTSIDVLRGKIDDFCSKVYMGLDLDTEVVSDYKYVFLDEFERTSTQYQDALKAYLEEYSKNGVRFILSTNHINKVSEGIRSRTIEVNFDCETIEEEKFLKKELLKRIWKDILPQEGIKIPKEELTSLINKEFPDFRKVMISLDYWKTGGSFNKSLSNDNLKVREDLYSIIYDKSLSYETIYHFIMENFGPEKIEVMINLFGKPFIEWSINNKRENIEKLFDVSEIVSENIPLLETNLDPVVQNHLQLS